MMSFKEIAKFAARRARLDSPLAFACRCLRGLLLWPAITGRDKTARDIAALMWVSEPAFSDETPSVRVPMLGNTMALSLTDSGISRDLLMDRIREPEATRLFRGMLKPGMVVIDIGANIGYYALQEASLVGEALGGEGRVYAVEPVQENYSRLLRNASLSGHHNMSFHRLAMGDQDRSGVIQVSSMSNMCSMVKHGGYRDYVGVEGVLVRKLDTFLEEVGKAEGGGKPVLPDVLRMDVEGYELEILEGATKTIGQTDKPMLIFMELHFDILLERSLKVLQMLKNWEFEVRAATFEPHPALKGRPALRAAVRVLEKGMGAQNGEIKGLTIADMIRESKWRRGQIEDIEVFFQRGVS